MVDISVARSDGLLAVATSWQHFSRWWLLELRQLVPLGWLGWVDGEASSRFLISRDRNSIVCQSSSASGPVEVQFPLQEFEAGVLNAWLVSCGLRREQVLIGPVIRRDLFFVRALKVPKAALAALPRILDQEVLRRTPFQLADIWHAATLASVESAEVLHMWHWIIRKDRAEAALIELGLGASDVDFLATEDENGGSVPVIRLPASSREDPIWARRAVRLLAAAGLIAVILGLVTFEWCQSNVATNIEASLIRARQGAQGGRGSFGPATRLFAMKADASILEIWDEISRILPDHTFLTETRIADGYATISGFSADAAHLVRIIDQSPMFSDANLAAAITPDATEQKDHFSIAFKVRRGRALRPSESASTSHD